MEVTGLWALEENRGSPLTRILECDSMFLNTQGAQASTQDIAIRGVVIATRYTIDVLEKASIKKGGAKDTELSAHDLHHQFHGVCSPKTRTRDHGRMNGAQTSCCKK